jgi:hypothetical protein
MRPRSSHIALIAAADGVVLALDRPRVHELADSLAHPVAWVAQAGADGAAAQLAGALLWLAAAWFGVALAVAAGACLPGRTGRAARRLCIAITPTTLARVLLGLAGAGIVLAPAASASASPVPAAVLSAPAPAVGSLPAVPAPTLPQLPPTALPQLPVPVPPRVHTPATPQTQPSTSPKQSQSAVPASPVAPTVLGHAAAPVWPMDATPADQRPARPAHTPTGGGARTHVVRPGDTLWTVTAASLGPDASPHQIATQWPRLYALNRSTLGADPGLIRAGQRLRLPPEWPTTASPQPSDQNEVPR